MNEAARASREGVDESTSPLPVIPPPAAKPHPSYPSRSSVPNALPSASAGVDDALILPAGPYRLLVSGSPERASAQLVAHLAKGAREVIAADAGAQTCRDAGVIPDVVVGDLDSLASEAIVWCRDAGARQQAYPWEKDESDLGLALRMLGQTSRMQDDPTTGSAPVLTRAAPGVGTPFLVITSALGGRLDHLLATVGSLACTSHLAPVIVEDGCLALVLDAEVGRSSIELSHLGCVESATVSVIALGEGARICAEGLRWEGDGLFLSALSDRGLSNYIVDPARARIEVLSGTVLVIIPRGVR